MTWAASVDGGTPDTCEAFSEGDADADLEGRGQERGPAARGHSVIAGVDAARLGADEVATQLLDLRRRGAPGRNRRPADRVSAGDAVPNP